MKIVNVKELRENLGAYIRRVGKGESFVVFRRSEPVFRIAPADEEDAWETVVDFTKARKGGVPIADILSRI